MRLTLVLFLCTFFLPTLLLAQNSVPLGQAVEKALKKSQLTAAGGKPFHLLAAMTEKDSPDSDYQAKVEMFWVSPAKWRRIITSENFSQTHVVNGDAVFEQNTGDYFPVWINNMVASIFDPIPMLETVRKSDREIPMSSPHGGTLTQSCADFSGRLDRWVICFQPSDGLLPLFSRKVTPPNSRTTLNLVTSASLA